eukprot:Lankesteria_metandrocarpae@DN4608_c0_g1_i1.p1
MHKNKTIPPGCQMAVLPVAPLTIIPIESRRRCHKLYDVRKPGAVRNDGRVGGRGECVDRVIHSSRQITRATRHRSKRDTSELETPLSVACNATGTSTRQRAPIRSPPRILDVYRPQTFCGVPDKNITRMCVPPKRAECVGRL